MSGNILVKNMTFKYPSMVSPLFNNVSVNIHEDWKLGLIGRNGRGKTTLLKILLDQLEYEGTVIASLEFKYFPSYPDLDDSLTAEEVLLKESPMTERWEMELELSYMDLPPETLDRSFHVLSGGEDENIVDWIISK